MTTRSVGLCSLALAALLAGLPAPAFAQTTGLTTVAEVAPVANPCPRAEAGALIQQPPALFSSHGVLNVQFSYQTATVVFHCHILGHEDLGMMAIMEVKPK